MSHKQNFWDWGFLPLTGLALLTLLGVSTYKWVHTETFGIPHAEKTAQVSTESMEKTSSFSSLKSKVLDDIRVNALRGARTTEVYVGEYDAASVTELRRILKARGYETYLNSPLSGTDDFLEIVW